MLSKRILAGLASARLDSNRGPIAEGKPAEPVIELKPMSPA